MTRFNSFITTLQPDFWRDRFKPKDLMRVFSHIQSVLSSRSDMKLLETYDIKTIPEHTVGYTRTWIPIAIAGETHLDAATTYPWMYAIVTDDGNIDDNWLYIDAIYDSHVDPQHRYQNGIDYKYSDGILRFRKQIPSTIKNLYISKGQYAGYRICNEIGSLIQYQRKDSQFYRDAIEPVMVSFYNNPTYKHLTALLNIAFGIPVAKYGDETVVSIIGDTITTDRYTYTVPSNIITVNKGDVLEQFQPFTTTIQLITNKTNPGWWRDKPPDLFKKYYVGTKIVKKVSVPDSDTRTYEECPDNYTEIPTEVENITEEDKVFLLENFLEDVILYIRINVDSVNVDGLIDSKDLMDLFYDALPTRTDPIISKVANPKDFMDSLTVPDLENAGVLLRINSIYGLHPEYSPIGMYAPNLGRPILRDAPEGTVEDATLSTDFSVGTYKWHIYEQDETSNFDEGWRYNPQAAPIFDPYFSTIYIRSVSQNSFNPSGAQDNQRILDLELPASMSERFQINYGGRIADLVPSDVSSTGGSIEFNPGIGVDGGSGYFVDISSVTDSCVDTVPDVVSVDGVTTFYPTDIEDSWSYNSTKLQKTKTGIALYVLGGATLSNIDDTISLGNIPKDVTIYTEYLASVEGLSSITMAYQTTGSQFTPAASSNQVYRSAYKDADDNIIDTLSKVSLSGVAGELSISYNISTSTLSDLPEIRRVVVKIDG